MGENRGGTRLEQKKRENVVICGRKWCDIASVQRNVIISILHEVFFSIFSILKTHTEMSVDARIFSLQNKVKRKEHMEHIDV